MGLFGIERHGVLTQGPTCHFTKRGDVLVVMGGLSYAPGGYEGLIGIEGRCVITEELTCYCIARRGLCVDSNRGCQCHEIMSRGGYELIGLQSAV